MAGVLLPAMALAHHALQSEFEINKPSRHWTGTLKAIHWINPHSRFDIEVDDGTGKMTTWTFETAAPNDLRRNTYPLYRFTYCAAGAYRRNVLFGTCAFRPKFLFVEALKAGFLRVRRRFPASM